MSNDTKNGDSVEYAVALKKSIDAVAKAIKTVNDMGFRLSTMVSSGRILSVGLRVGEPKRGRPPQNQIEVETDYEG